MVKKSKLRRKRAKLADKLHNGLSQQFIHCYSPEFWLPSVVLASVICKRPGKRQNGRKNEKELLGASDCFGRNSPCWIGVVLGSARARSIRHARSATSEFLFA
jgi:hypothetical protein